MDQAHDHVSNCELCRPAGGEVLWTSSRCRVIAVEDPAYPGYCRVIWNSHRVELSDLSPSDQAYLMRVVAAVEGVLRHLYQPDKINLAAFGNVVPHLHWHIIPRWRADKHFPNPVWGEVLRPDARPTISVTRSALEQALRSTLGELEKEPS